MYIQTCFINVKKAYTAEKQKFFYCNEN